MWNKIKTSVEKILIKLLINLKRVSKSIKYIKYTPLKAKKSQNMHLKIKITKLAVLA